MQNPKFIFLAVVVTLSGCKGFGDVKSQTLHNKEFNWTITIPEGFEKVSAEDWAKLQNKGAQAIENTYGEKIENLSTIIFAFRNGQLNYLEANYQPYDKAVDGDYRSSC